MEMREKIAKINYESYTGLSWVDADEEEKKGAYAHADRILALPIDDFEVVRECLNCKGSGKTLRYVCLCGEWDAELSTCYHLDCNGTGTITRPLTMKDVDISKLINDVTNLNEQQLGLYTNKLHYLYNPLSLQTPDGGRVRRKK